MKDFIVGRYEAGKENEKVVVKKNTEVYSITLDNGFKTTYGYNGNTIGVPYTTGEIRSPYYLLDELKQSVIGAYDLAKDFSLNKTYSNSVFSSLTYLSTYQATLDFFAGWDYNKKEEILNSIPVGGTQVTTIKTGTDGNRKFKNIYDFRGNVAEWMNYSNPGICIYGADKDYYSNNKNVELLNTTSCSFGKDTICVYGEGNLAKIQSQDGQKYIIGFRPCLFIK